MWSTIAWGGPLQFDINRIDLSIHTDYFETHANHDVGGNTFSRLNDDQLFTNWTTQFFGRWSLSEKWALFGHLNVAHSRSVGKLATRTSSAFSEGGLGVDFMVSSGFFIVTTQLFGAFPFRSVALDTDEVIISEGAKQIGAKLYVAKPLKSFLSWGSLGIVSRSDGRSTLIPWELALSSKFHYWMIEGRIYGYENLGDDQYTEIPSTRTSVTDRVNAGSLHFFSINPKSVAWEAMSGYRWTPTFETLLGYGSTITGSSSASGFHVLGLVRFSLGESQTQRIRRLRSEKLDRRSRKNVDEFEYDEEKSDVELFEIEEENKETPKKFERFLRESEQELEGL